MTAVLDQLGSRDNPGLPVSCPSQCAVAVAAIAENVMGGSSGAVRVLLVTYLLHFPSLVDPRFDTMDTKIKSVPGRC